MDGVVGFIWFNGMIWWIYWFGWIMLYCELFCDGDVLCLSFGWGFVGVGNLDG